MAYDLADHLVTPRIGYTHHGLYAGNGTVLEYSRKGVNLVSLEEFSEGYPVSVEPHLMRIYNRHESVQRGISRLGEDEYNLIFNNCERFVNWCINGLPVSSQVESATLQIIELAYKNYMGSHQLPRHLVSLLNSNPELIRQLTNVFFNNKRIFDVLGPAMAMVNSSILHSATTYAATAATSTIGASTVAGLAGGTAAGLGTGAILGGLGTTGTLATAGLAALGGTALAPIAIGSTIAVAAGVGIKKLFDFITD